MSAQVSPCWPVTACLDDPSQPLTGNSDAELPLRWSSVVVPCGLSDPRYSAAERSGHQRTHRSHPWGDRGFWQRTPPHRISATRHTHYMHGYYGSVAGNSTFTAFCGNLNLEIIHIIIYLATATAILSSKMWTLFYVFIIIVIAIVVFIMQ